MTFTVVWKPDADRTLAQLWVDAPDRNAVSAAARLIDKTLREGPAASGSSSEEQPILVAPPLGVHYEVIPDDCLVRVLKVWLVEYFPEPHDD